MRIKYEDSMNQSGEMELASVRVGDIVRFIGDFKKVGPEVRADELGEVSAVLPESLKISAPGTRRAEGGDERGEVEVEVAPIDVVIVVHPEDDRVFDAKPVDDESIKLAAAGLQLWELEDDVAHAFRGGADPFDSGMVAAELLRARRRTAAIANGGTQIILAAPAAAWRELVFGFGFRRAQVDPQEWIDLGMEEAELEESRRVREEAEKKRKPYQINTGLVSWAIIAIFGRRPEAPNRQDAIYAVRALAHDMLGSIPPDARGTAEEINAQLQAERLEAAAAQLENITDEEWREVHEWQRELTRWHPTIVLPERAPRHEPAELEATFEGRVTVGQPQELGSRRVYADPGMEVFNKLTKAKGEVIGVADENTLIVNVDGDEQQWDAMAAIVSHGWKGPRQFAPVEEVTDWKKKRRKRRFGFALESPSQFQTGQLDDDDEWATAITI